MSGAEANNDDGPRQRHALLAKQDKLPGHHKYLKCFIGPNLSTLS
jgi:hypothetical protein